MHRKVSGLAVEGSAGRLPAELTKFLSQETYSLLIKGPSGSGKTALALTILAKFRASENVLYLSTRTSTSQLAKSYPWIGKAAGLAAGPAPKGAPGEGSETLVDARLDEPGVVFERITNVLMDRHAPMVVVDSWEALNESMEAEALRTNIRVLQTWRERAGARFLFIGEDATNSSIDSVVDGVVSLSEQVVYGRRLREIYLSKLHGVQISSPKYFFSLENGVFSSFERYTQSDLPTGRGTSRREPGRVGKAGRHSTGFRQLDQILGGGYHGKSMAWIEMDPQVDSRAVVAFLSGTVREWAESGSSVLLQMSEVVDASMVAQLKASLRGSAHENLKVWGPAAGKGGRVDYMSLLQSNMATAPTPVLCIVDYDKFARRGPSTKTAASESLMDFLRRRAELSILVTRSGHPLSGIVSTHLRIIDLGGTLFVMSEKPWSELYAVVPGPGAGGMSLERVV